MESAKRLGLEIPVFCYHPRMKPVGMCRMCLVEVGFKQADGSVRKMPKPQAACTLPAQDNLVVFTETDVVKRDRKGVLEFLLINHPLDCPICDRGGECPLQNNTIFYGPATSRFVEIKRHAHKAFPLSEYVTLDLERCIQCGRCVRFTEEISGDAELAFRFRGSNMQPSTFGLRHFGSKFSGNVIEICPVGALTNKEYRFRARPWDLETKPGICLNCSVGCNVWMDHRVGKIVRINGRTNEAVNEEWTCDKGKFGHHRYETAERLTKPLLRKGDRLEECDWPEAYAEILKAFGVGGDKVGALAGDDLSMESLYALDKLFRGNFGSNNLGNLWVRHADAPQTAKPAFASYEDKTAILVFGTALSDDLPILHLRVRKAWFKNGAKVIVAHHEETDADSFAHLILRYHAGSEDTLAQALLSAAKGEDLGNAETVTGVKAEHIKEAASLLAGGAILSTDALLDTVDGPVACSALSSLAEKTGATYGRYARGSSDPMCAEMGWNSPAKAILEGCADGKIEALWLANIDPFAVHADRPLVEKSLSEVPFLVVQASTMTESCHFASVVLPMALPAEQDGTYLNAERRIQRMQPVLAAKGESKPVWKVCGEISMRIKIGTPAFSASEVFGRLAKDQRAFDGLSYEKVGGEGFVLPS